MGSSNSKKSKLLSLSDDIKTLKNELQSLKDLDKNHDGIITKDEFLEWKNEQKGKMTDLEKKIEEQLNNKYAKIISEKDAQLVDSKNKIDELTKQMEALKNINSGLEAKLIHVDSPNNTEALNKLQELSKAKIDEFVEQLLNDKNVNIGYLPDFVERQIYKNVFNLIIGLLNNTLSTASVKLLGHQLTFMITPETDEISKDTNENKLSVAQEIKKDGIKKSDSKDKSKRMSDHEIFKKLDILLNDDKQK